MGYFAEMVGQERQTRGLERAVTRKEVLYHRHLKLKEPSLSLYVSFAIRK